MTAALTRSNCEETFRFSAGQRTVWVSVMSSSSSIVKRLACRGGEVRDAIIIHISCKRLNISFYKLCTKNNVQHNTLWNGRIRTTCSVVHVYGKPRMRTMICVPPSELCRARNDWASRLFPANQTIAYEKPGVQAVQWSGDSELLRTPSGMTQK